MIETIKTLVLKVAEELTFKKLKLVTAESCTGGGLSYWLTSVPHSSTWFERGFVTYSNEAKNEMLAVNKNVIEEYGAVSKETACAMAEGALLRSPADISIAITGIAGPAGGTKEKPVGLIWISLSQKIHSSCQTQAERYHFLGDRQTIRLQTIAKALEIIKNGAQ